MPNKRFPARRLVGIIQMLDPDSLAETERLLALPVPAPFRGLPLYEGPNHAGLVNTLVSAASRIARGAYDDGLGLADLVVAEHIARRSKS